MAPEVTVTVAGVDKSTSQTTQDEVLERSRRRYRKAGPEHKRQLPDRAQASILVFASAAIGSSRERGGTGFGFIANPWKSPPYEHAPADLGAMVGKRPRG